MKIEVSMSGNELFEVGHWWAKTPAFVRDTLQAQLEAASAIWPELKEYVVVKRRMTKSEAMALGGHARAAALSADRRKEIAGKAAQTRWRGGGKSVESDNPAIKNPDGTLIS